MLVSVIIPAYRAAQTIGRAVISLLAQTSPYWEGIIVADDRQDYAAILGSLGIADPRLRFVSTGEVRSGCHNARNIGLMAARGDVIAQLDADDSFDCRRLAILVPLALYFGAVADQVGVVSETGNPLYRTQPCGPAAGWLTPSALLDLSVPLWPVMDREFAELRLAGIEYAEDVVANLRLLDRLGSIPLVPEPLYQYRVVDGSLCHGDDAAAQFEAAYSGYIGRLRSGDGFCLDRNRGVALTGFVRKRELNRRFADARCRRRGLTFQAFMSPYSGLVSHALGTLDGPASPVGMASASG